MIRATGSPGYNLEQPDHRRHAGAPLIRVLYSMPADLSCAPFVRKLPAPLYFTKRKG